jgi:Na+-translocating ferredoxin:NAD+ oxidoreductase RnfD subunit
MEKEKELSTQESLELITGMISKARNDYQETGISALFWGTIVSFCSLVTFFNYYWGWRVLDYIWFLSIIAVIPQILISARERKLRKHRRYHDDLVGGIWISYVIAVFIVAYITITYKIDQADSIFLVLYGIPTFASGYGKRFRPMIIGGIACWIFSILCLYTPWPYQILYNAAAALLAWFIPGLLLRKCYLKAKKQHV